MNWPIKIGESERLDHRQKAQIHNKKFIIKGGYPFIKHELEMRGWTEQSDSESGDFDFRFTSIIKDSNFTKLKKHQICNHFDGITQLCLKSTLSNNTKDIDWYYPIEIKNFIPITFSIPERDSIEDFTIFHEHTKVELKVWLGVPKIYGLIPK